MADINLTNAYKAFFRWFDKNFSYPECTYVIEPDYRLLYSEGSLTLISGLSGCGKTQFAETLPRRCCHLDKIGFQTDNGWMIDVTKFIRLPLVEGLACNLDEITRIMRFVYPGRALTLVWITQEYEIWRRAVRRKIRDCHHYKGYVLSFDPLQYDDFNQATFNMVLQAVKPDYVMFYNQIPSAELPYGWSESIFTNCVN